MSREIAPPPVAAPPSGWRQELVGLDEPVPTPDGRLIQPVGLDNAATTPAMHAAVDAVLDCLRCYGSVHRGAGHNARVSTAAYEHAHEAIRASSAPIPAPTSPSSAGTRPRRSTSSPRTCRRRPTRSS